VSLSNLNFNKLRDDFDTAIFYLGSDATFKLRDGTTFTIKCARRTRVGTGVTEGLNQDRLEIQIPYAFWNSHSSDRPPQKGDQVTMYGTRAGLDDIRTVGAGDTLFGWICRLVA
jgi:hypothetical protein